MRVGGEHGEAVGGRDEEAAADDEVTVAIAVGGSAEVGRLRAHHQVVKVLGVDEVGIGMMAAEIGARHSVDHAARRRAEVILQDSRGVGSGHGVHRVEAQGQAAGDGGADGVEIEQRAHQRLVVGDGIDDFDRRRAELDRADHVEIDVGGLDDGEALDQQGAGVDRLGHALGRGAAVAGVVLDAEVAVRTAGIMRGGEDEAAEGAARADHAGGGGRREEAALPHQHAGEAMRRRHLENGLDRFAVEVAAVAADDEGLPGDVAQRVED